MSDGANAIREVVVAGGGIVGWSAAAALKRRLPGLRVTVVPVPPPADALADRIASTLPSIVEFHRDIGLSDADAVVRAGSGFRLGTCFDGWAEDLPAYVHAYGEYGRPFGTASFHLHWVRAAHRAAAAAFDSHSPAAAIARAGRFVQPQGEDGSPLAGFEYGLQLNLAALPRDDARLCAPSRRRPSAAAGLRACDCVARTASSRRSRLDDGSEIDGASVRRLHRPGRDCCAPRSTRISNPGSAGCPATAILFAEAASAAEPTALDNVDRDAGRLALAGGVGDPHLARPRLCLGASRRRRRGSARCGRPPAPSPPGRRSTIRAGRRAQPWLRNCVAVGDAAVAMEPLEWGNLHLAHSAIDRIVSMMPDRDCGAVELWDYNRQSAAEADRMRDFLVLHYVAARAARALLAGGRRGRAAGLARPHLVAVQGTRAAAHLRGRNLLPRLLACRADRPGRNSANGPIR